jgi:hypothetical protein
VRALGFVMAAIVLGACGGAAPENHVNVPPQPSASASASSAENPTPDTTTIHYDDLGIAFTVPKWLHVMGDDELAKRVSASANAHLQADLKNRAAEKRGVPLLALSRNDMNVTLLIVAVPPDATALELASHQRSAMEANLAKFQSTGPTKQLMTDGVPGAEIESRYAIEDTNMSSKSRIWVRSGVGTILTVAWKENAEAGNIAILLDGLHFTPLAQP